MIPAGWRRWPPRCLFVALLLAWAAQAGAEPRPVAGQPSQVRVVEEAGGYRLQVNGQPFHVRGAGLEHGDVATLAARGGNALRTWRVDDDNESGRQRLDRALEAGLFVALGLEVARERHGFDYDDRRAVARQLARLRRTVQRHKDHPALLFWVVGNELNLESRNPRVWDALNDILLMIREEDPQHPALTTLAGFDAALIAELRRRAPALQLLGVQLYGDIARVGSLREAGWGGPYLVTEWGPNGHWEVPRTPWGAPIEDSSAVKAALLAERYRQFILADPTHCLGSFVFLWGHKQERTPTWYGMFLASGEATAAVDTMQQAWTGGAPAVPAPRVDQLSLQGQSALEGVVVSPGQWLQATVEAEAAAGASLDFAWQVREESRATSIGGDPETLPPTVEVNFDTRRIAAPGFRAPLQPGAYRLFVTVRDGRGGAGHANLPFFVQP